VVGGVVVGRPPVASIVTTAPVTQVVTVGTADLPDPTVVVVEPGSAQALGKQLAAERGWGDDQFACLLDLWNQESGWRVNAGEQSSGAYGIPQALPGSKMATVVPTTGGPTRHADHLGPQLHRRPLRRPVRRLRAQPGQGLVLIHPFRV
jgi:hypothetical protein